MVTRLLGEMMKYRSPSHLCWPRRGNVQGAVDIKLDASPLEKQAISSRSDGQKWSTRWSPRRPRRRRWRRWSSSWWWGSWPSRRTRTGPVAGRAPSTACTTPTGCACQLSTPSTSLQTAAAAAVATTWHIHCHSLSLALHLQEDSDLESYLASVEEDMMEFKLSYEMWRVGRWAVSIPLVGYKYRRRCGVSCGPSYLSQETLCGKRKEKKKLVFNSALIFESGVSSRLQASWEDDRLTLTVHLEEKDSPENLQWDIKKTYMDIVYFRNRWQVNVLR